MPAEDHLRRGPVECLCDLPDLGVVEQLGLGQRTPGLRADPVLVVEATQFRLLETGVKLDLVDRRDRLWRR